MANRTPAAAKPTSAELAADISLVSVWDAAVPFPSPKEMRDLDGVNHVVVETAQPDGYHYLNTSTIAWHNDRFYACWTNHLTKHDDARGELIRGRVSADGLHWSEPSTWLEPPRSGADSLNYPLLFTHADDLIGFFSGWHDGNPTAELFLLEDDKFWQYYREACIPRFFPLCPPQLTAEGNWIMGGEYHFHTAAVAISRGDDIMQWKRVEIPKSDSIELLYPETAIINRGDSLLAFCRPYKTSTAPVSESRDGGRTWTPLGLSNFPLAPSKPFAGKLSTGQNYLLTNSLDAGRFLLTIAVTGPKGGLFRRIFRLRHQQAGMTTEWSYPSAIEHDGKLYITYTQGKEDCVLSIVPIESMTA